MIILAILLSACFPHNTGRAITFNPTNSMCMDAVVANMHSSGCYVVSVEKSIYGVTTISCQEILSRDSIETHESSWISNEFFAISFGTRVPDDVQPICTDPFVIMTTSEKD